MFMTQSTRVTGSSSHSMVPVSDTAESKDKDLEPLADTRGADPSLPFLEELEVCVCVCVCVLFNITPLLELKVSNDHSYTYMYIPPGTYI